LHCAASIESVSARHRVAGHFRRIKHTVSLLLGKLLLLQLSLLLQMLLLYLLLLQLVLLHLLHVVLHVLLVRHRICPANWQQ
jgi:hypothetical protein